MRYSTNEKVVNGGTFENASLLQENRNAYKIRWLIGLQLCSTAIILLMIGSFYFLAHSTIKHKTVYINVTNENYQKKDNITTLYAMDPIASMFCFGDGEYGQTISDWTVYNRDSDIDFNNYKTASFSVGIEGGRVATIVDLGSKEELQEKYKYPETVGHGQGFASIHRRNQTLLILKSSTNGHNFQTMDESAQLFAVGTSAANALVKLGHVYALRITDQFTRDFERIVKILVIAYRPGESVTIRWALLP